MRGLVRIVAAIAVAVLILSGCAARHDRLLPASDETPSEPKVDMLVVSTRATTGKAYEYFSGERADRRTLYHFVVSLPPDGSREIGHIQWPQGRPVDPAKDFATVSATPMQRPDVDRWFLNVAGRKRKLLIFVHGYNETFAEAAYRLAQITHDSGTDAIPILFTWPSRAEVLDYVYDTNSATYSRDDLEFLLTRAATDPNVSDITVMAHSLGNWTMMEALRQMAIRRGRVHPKIRNVIMASADLDIDVFEKQLEQITGPRPRTTIFAANDDVALALSKRIAGNIDRVGDAIPEAAQKEARLKQFNIAVINLTRLKSGDRYNHDKSAESAEIIKLIGTRLMDGHQILGSQLTLGEQIVGATANAASSVGHATKRF